MVRRDAGREGRMGDQDVGMGRDCGTSKGGGREEIDKSSEKYAIEPSVMKSPCVVEDVSGTMEKSFKRHVSSFSATASLWGEGVSSALNNTLTGLAL
jgi:hypothetical protein